MPPEQFGGRGRSTAGDLWALGVLSYELLVGEPGPFEADDVGEASPTRLRCFDRSASPQQKVEAYAGAGAAAKREAIRRRLLDIRPERSAADAADAVVSLLQPSEAAGGSGPFVVPQPCCHGRMGRGASALSCSTHSTGESNASRPQ